MESSNIIERAKAMGVHVRGDSGIHRVSTMKSRAREQNRPAPDLSGSRTHARVTLTTTNE